MKDFQILSENSAAPGRRTTFRRTFATARGSRDMEHAIDASRQLASARRRISGPGSGDEKSRCDIRHTRGARSDQGPQHRREARNSHAVEGSAAAAADRGRREHGGPGSGATAWRYRRAAQARDDGAGAAQLKKGTHRTGVNSGCQLGDSGAGWDSVSGGAVAVHVDVPVREEAVRVVLPRPHVQLVEGGERVAIRLGHEVEQLALERRLLAAAVADAVPHPLELDELDADEAHEAVAERLIDQRL